MKPSLLVALAVGLVVGTAVGKMASPPSEGAPKAPSARSARAAAPSNVDATRFKVPVDGRPTLGPDDALITLVEFSDFQCPYCKRAEGTLKELQQKYGDDIRIVARQNPLGFHAQARGAALAALAAGKQGRYWEMHEKLFQNPRTLSPQRFTQYAQELGLDMTRFDRDMKSPELAKIISEDQALAEKLDARGTPAFFINGRKISGARATPVFVSLIEEELKVAREKVSQGTSRSRLYASLMQNALERAPTPPPRQPTQEAPKVAKIDIPADAPSFGPKNAKVTIVEWSDFECPYCARMVAPFNTLKERYPRDVRVVFRHQPLSFHKNAQLAAEASMAAHAQGRFWEYHDKLFEDRKRLDRASLEQHARDLGLDMRKFTRALDEGTYTARVKKDSQEGMAVGARGTPTFFVNGKLFSGAKSFEQLEAIVKPEIARADELLKKGTPRGKLYDALIADALKNADKGPPPVEIEVGQAPTRGPRSAPATLVVFSDFQCPYCSRAVPVIEQLEEKYGDKVQVVFKHLPLDRIHPHARIAAQASMAAHEQGKFWEYHDKLFANQRQLSRPDLEKYAQELGLNMTRFKAALDSKKLADLVQGDLEQAQASGVSGTPTFFVNGQKARGANPTTLGQLIDQAIASDKKG